MMGIKSINASLVSCQRCPSTILVVQWWDAAQSGWAVPSDGHLQLRPECVAKQKAAFSAEFLQQRIVKALDSAKALIEKG